MLPAAGAILLYRRHQKKKRETERLANVRVRQQRRKDQDPLLRKGKPLEIHGEKLEQRRRMMKLDEKED